MDAYSDEHRSQNIAVMRERCNRHVNGHCSTRACLRRGGWRGETPVNFDMATCMEREIAMDLEELAALKP